MAFEGSTVESCIFSYFIFGVRICIALSIINYDVLFSFLCVSYCVTKAYFVALHAEVVTILYPD